MLAYYLVNDLDLIGDLDSGPSQLLLAVPQRTHQKQKAEHLLRITMYMWPVKYLFCQRLSRVIAEEKLILPGVVPYHYAECQRDLIYNCCYYSYKGVIKDLIFDHLKPVIFSLN